MNAMKKLLLWNFLVCSTIVIPITQAETNGQEAHSNQVAPEEVTPTSENQKSPQIANQKTTETININTADAETLQTLKGIGPKRAKAIIDYRQNKGPFEELEDFMKVKGIGPKTFEKNKEKIRVYDEDFNTEQAATVNDVQSQKTEPNTTQAVQNKDQ